EDLLEDMLKLDSLAGLYQADREVRKLALSQLDDLVDQVDTAKAQLLKRRKELEAMVEVAADANPVQLEKEVTPPESPAAESREPEASRSYTESPRLEDVRCRLRLQSQERPQGYVVSANARGVSAEDIDLQLDGDLLRIMGFARPTLQDAAFLRSRLRREPCVEDYAAFGFGRFQEAIRVPADVDVNKIQASCHDGQLQLILPRRPRQFPQSYHSLRSRPPMFPVW
ncbi:HSP16.0, partial [Symbiodinium sp. CCMP2456]